VSSAVSLKAVVMALLAHKTEPLTLTALCKVANATRSDMTVAVLSLQQAGDLRYHYPTDSCEAIKRGDAL